MTPGARTDALKAAGVTGYTDKSPWERISTRNRARLEGVRQAPDDEARTQFKAQQAAIQRGTAPEPVPAPKRTREQASAERKRAYRDADLFRSSLAEHGVSVEDRPDVGGERNRPVMVPYHGPLFRKNGLRLDELATRAVEAGFLTQADVDSALDNGGVNKLADMIRREIGGERI